jgi:PAS domain S-box-containing protein
MVSAQSVEATNEDIKTDGTVFFFEIAMLTVILMIFLIRLVFSESKGNQLNRQRYHFVTKYSDSIIIDYSCAKDTMFCNENWKKVMGFEPERKELKSDITRYIADEDKERFNQIIEVLRKEKEFVKFQVGVKKEDGEVVKCIFKLAAIKTKRGKLQKVVGVIEPSLLNV